jgi:ribosomal protein S15P/S13E
MPAKQRSKKNHPQNVAYKAQNQRMRNKIRNLKRHVGRFPEDQQSAESLALIVTNKPGIKGKRTWLTKYKRDTTSTVKGNTLFMYRERKT